MKKQLIATLLTTTMLISGQTISPLSFGNQENLALTTVKAADVIEPPEYVMVNEGYCGPSAKWKFNSKTGTLTISGSGAMYNYTGVYDDYEEATIDYRPWDSIDAYITNIKIGDKITSIGKDAFWGLNSLKTVTIGKKVTKIGSGAFESCKNLTKVSIPGSVKEIGSQAFLWCQNLKSLSIGKNVKTITDDAFSYSTVETIKVASKNKSFTATNNMLMNKKQTKIYLVGKPKNGIFTVPAKVTKIIEGAINQCVVSKFSVAKGNSYFTVKNNCLYKINKTNKKTSLVSTPAKPTSETTITLSDSMYLHKSDTVKELVIGKDFTMKQWKEQEFSYIMNASVEHSATTNKLNEFFINLENIKVEEENPYFSSKDGVLYSKDGSTLIYCPGKKAGEYQIPEGVTAIDDYAFYKCKELTNITMPNTVTSAGISAFEDCSKLKTIALSNQITKLNKDTFKNCDTLETLSIPKSVTTMTEAVSCCENLQRIEIGSGLKELNQEYAETDIKIEIIPDNYIFSECDSLKEIVVSADNPNFTSENGILYNKDKTTLLRYPTQLAIDYVMPDTVTKVLQGAFGDWGKYDLYDLVDFEEDFQKIEEYAKSVEKCKVKSIRYSDAVENDDVGSLVECDQCDTVYVGKNMSVLPAGIFDCTKVEIAEENPYFCIENSIIFNKEKTYIEGCLTNISGKITVPDTVEVLYSGTFLDCKNITSIIINGGTTNITKDAFSGCSKLKEIKVKSKNTKYASNKDGILYNKAKTTVIFCPANKTGKVTLPNSVTTINKEAFKDCKSITQITIPDKVKKINARTFEGCKKLKKVVLGKKISTIDAYSFLGCTSLKNIQMKMTNLKTLGKGAFYGVPTNVTIKVPKSKYSSLRKKCCTQYSGLSKAMKWKKQ